MDKKIWDLFTITGDIKYYMMYKEMEKLEEDAEDKSERDSNRRD